MARPELLSVDPIVFVPAIYEYPKLPCYCRCTNWTLTGRRLWTVHVVLRSDARQGRRAFYLRCLFSNGNGYKLFTLSLLQ